MPDTFTSTHRAEITALAALHRLPAVYPFRLFAELGGLLSYGNDLIDDFGRAANYADRHPQGRKSERTSRAVPVKFELVVNLKTAKALGSRYRSSCSAPVRCSNEEAEGHRASPGHGGVEVIE